MATLMKFELISNTTSFKNSILGNGYFVMANQIVMTTVEFLQDDFKIGTT